MAEETLNIEELGREKIVVLFTAENQKGEEFYCYIRLTVEDLGNFSIAQDKGEDANLLDLGEVVARGWGHVPPEEVQKEIEDKYGIVESNQS